MLVCKLKHAIKQPVLLPASDSPFRWGQQMKKALCFCQLQQRCALKPFSVNKLALFEVMTCLSLSAWALGDPLTFHQKEVHLLLLLTLLHLSLHLVAILPQPSWPFVCPSFYCLMPSGTAVLKLFQAYSCENVHVHWIECLRIIKCPLRCWWIYWSKVWQSLTGGKCHGWLKQSFCLQVLAPCVWLGGKDYTLKWSTPCEYTFLIILNLKET